MHLTACLVLCLVINFLLKLLELRIYFDNPSCQVLFVTLELIVKKKKKISDPSYECIQSLHFSTWLKIEAFFPQTKGSSHEIDLLYDWKYKNEIDENCKAPTIDTIITLERLDLPFHVHCAVSKYHLKVGEYSTGGIGDFIEFL